MAPKKGGKAVAKGKAKAKAKALAEQELSKKSRSDEAQALRTLEFHTKTWPSADMVTRVDGQTVYQYVREKVAECRRQKQRLGSRFWTDVRTRYEGCGKLSERLQVVNKDASIDPQLKVAANAVFTDNTHRRGLSQMTRFLNFAKEANQREVVVILRVICDSTMPSRTGGHLMIMSGLRLALKLDWKEKYPKEMAIAAPAFDRALTHHWFSLSKAHVQLLSFWNVHRSVAGFFMNVEDVDAVVADLDKADPSMMERILRGSALGGEMFAATKKNLDFNEFGRRLESLLDPWRRAGRVEDEDIEHYVDKATELETTMLESLGGVRHKREIEVLYLKHKLKLSVSSPPEETALRMNACLKSLCVGRDQCVFLSFEGELHDEPAGGSAAAIPEHIASQFRLVRDTVEMNLKDMDKTKDSLAWLVKARHTTLASIDESWVIEEAFIEQIGNAAGLTFLATLVKKSMPTASATITITQASERIKALMDSPTMLLLGKEHKDSLKHCLELSSTLVNGHELPYGDAKGDIVSDAWLESAKRWLTCRIASGNLVGVDAAKTIYSKLLKSQCSDEERAELIRSLGPFARLLTQPEREEYRKWCKALATPSTTSAPEPPKKKAKASKAKAAEMTSVALFD